MPHRPLPRWLRQWLRISVRGLIVLVLIIGTGLGWIVQGARIQREAVAAIRSDGGLVLYDWDATARWIWNGQSHESDGKPDAPKWLVDRLGVDYFGPAVSVALSKPKSPSIFRNIGRLNHIEKLDVHGPFVTDAGLAHLEGLTNLYSLDIGDRYFHCDGAPAPRGTARVTDAGLSYLKGLTKLSSLDLNGTQVGDVGLASLAGLTKLEILRLSDTLVTDAGLAHLEGLTKLRGLEVGGTAVTDAGLVRLRACSDLESLGLSGTRITDAGLAHLEGFSKLMWLDLSGTRITDAGLAHLEGLTKLVDLDLRDTQVSDAEARKLERKLELLVRRRVSVQLGHKNGAAVVKTTTE